MQENRPCAHLSTEGSDWLMRSSELFAPSLGKGWRETRSYEVDRLFLVAFFGGTIPMMILGTRNAKWLNVSKRVINGLIATGVLFTILGFGLFYMAVEGEYSTETTQAIKFAIRALAVVLFFLYRMVLKKPYQQHLVTNGELTPLLKPAILWIIAGALIQFVIFTGFYIIIDW
jgi:hypothetical protein